MCETESGLLDGSSLFEIGTRVSSCRMDDRTDGVVIRVLSLTRLSLLASMSQAEPSATSSVTPPATASVTASAIPPVTPSATPSTPSAMADAMASPASLKGEGKSRVVRVRMKLMRGQKKRIAIRETD